MQKISHFPCRQLIMKTRLPKVLLKQATSPPLVAHPLIATAHNRSTIFARWRQCTWPCNTWAHHIHHPKQQLDRSNCFCMADIPYMPYTLHCAAPSPQRYLRCLLKELNPIQHKIIGPIRTAIPNSISTESAISRIRDHHQQTDRRMNSTGKNRRLTLQNDAA